MSAFAAVAAFAVLLWLFFGRVDGKAFFALLALLVVLLVASMVTAAKPQPALVILCAKGGIVNHGGLLANASECVLHDKYGGSATSETLAVFSDWGHE